MPRGPILKIAVPVPRRESFDYLPPADFKAGEDMLPAPGTRVQVPFGSRQLIGVLVGTAKKSAINPAKLKYADAFLDKTPALTPEILHCALRAASYYYHPEGEVLRAALPARLRTPRKRDEEDQKKESSDGRDMNMSAKMVDPPSLAPDITPGEEQLSAVREILSQSTPWRPCLLHGVTGSGKTEVYKRVALDIVRRNCQALILVPEIGLTPQIAVQFSEYFGDALEVMHSGMTSVQRYRAWQRARAGHASVVIGTRSAVFTPMPHLGLIVVDEEHDISFKQQEGFRYSARDVAILRAQAAEVPLVLGSATPSLESMHNARKNRYRYLALSMRPKGVSMPTYRIVDTRGQKMQGGMSATLMQDIEANFSKGNQSLIFINRRGYARAWMCTHCRLARECPNCSARLVFHIGHERLRCHHCNHNEAPDKTCPQCGAASMSAIGVGTQQCTQVLGKIFPEIPVYRVDSDNVRGVGALKAILGRVNAGEPCVLTGTQMLSKGHDFPNLTLVAILDSDKYLHDIDFRASERFGQMIMQVAGRAGRLRKPGKVIIQTREPDNPNLYQLTHHNYMDFAETLLEERRRRQLPPYGYMALLNCEARSSVLAEVEALKFRKALSQKMPKDLLLVGPVPPILNMRAKWHRRMIIIYASSRAIRAKALTQAYQLLEHARFGNTGRSRWFMDIDPQRM
jgi:primosomal protein N' (replication factor Y)